MEQYTGEIQSRMKPIQENVKSLAIQSSESTIQANSGSILLISLAFFLAQYAIAWSICFRRWRGHKRIRACSSCIAFIHSTVAATLAAREIWTTPWILDAPNTAVQNRIMEWSISFFTVDLIHYIAASPSDRLFIAHHLATLTYILSCRYYAYSGAKSVMYLTAAGEITTPLQAVWTLAMMRREDSRFAERVYSLLSPVFTISFTVVRGILGPYLFFQLFKFYVYGRDKHLLPKWLTCLWMIKVAAGIIGSAVWGFRLWSGLIKFYLHRLTIFTRSGRARRQD